MNQADGLLTIAILLVLLPGSVGLGALVCSEIGARQRRSEREPSGGRVSALRSRFGVVSLLRGRGLEAWLG